MHDCAILYNFRDDKQQKYRKISKHKIKIPFSVKLGIKITFKNGKVILKFTYAVYEKETGASSSNRTDKSTGGSANTSEPIVEYLCQVSKSSVGQGYYRHLL